MLALLPEGLGSVPRTHVELIALALGGLKSSFWPLQHGMHKPTQRHIYIHISESVYQTLTV